MNDLVKLEDFAKIKDEAYCLNEDCEKNFYFSISRIPFDPHGNTASVICPYCETEYLLDYWLDFKLSLKKEEK